MSAPESSQTAPKSAGEPGAAKLHRKRSSVQSNLSSMSNGRSQGSGHGSLNSSCNSTAASSDDLDTERPSNLTANADYEHLRNTTLLFFLDRLYLASREGKEPRTLHDLSCLFGTKDFTKEMRQIVGASRNGLRRFLESYPSLFQIEGDTVHLTQLKLDTRQAQRDYNREAVEYFRQKLLQFGNSLVPIKNLFGYRSQATQEVRHVSGKSSRDFKRFLSENDDVFEILADEHVVLKSTLRELESLGQSSSELERSLQPAEPEEAALNDPYLNRQFALLVEDCIKKLNRESAGGQQGSASDNNAEFRVTLEFLHEKIQEHCKNELLLKSVKTVDDLKVFLRMHPKLFKRSRAVDESASGPPVERDFVGLLSEAERRELETVAPYSALALARQPSSLQSGPAEPPHSLPPMLGAGASQACRPQSAREAPGPAEPGAEGRRQQGALAGQRLRANAPPFVPGGGPAASPASQRRHQGPLGQAPAVPRSLSNLSPGAWRPPVAGQHSVAAAQQQRQTPIDQREAIRSYLLRGNQLNGPNQHNLSWVQRNQAQQQQQQAPQAQQPSSGVSSSSSNLTGSVASDMRARTVDIVREAANIITRMMTTAEAVAFDCKGYNLGFDGQITLIQFGYLPTKQPLDPTKPAARQPNASSTNQPAQAVAQQAPTKPEVCVFDLITNPELAYCLKPLLESDKVVKIVHDVRNKSNALHTQFDITLSNVFDTQVANLVIQQQETGKPAYKSRYISMSKLCEIYGNPELMRYRSLIMFKTRHSSSQGAGGAAGHGFSTKDVNYWRTRPLTRPMIFEATMDVYCLIGGIYQNLRAKIKPEYEPLFEQLNVEGVFARIKPDEIKSAKKERKIDLEVIDLKRKLYTDSTGPIVLSNREIRLLRHIDLTEGVRQKIQQCKKVAKKLERLDMKAALLKQQLEDPDGLGAGAQSLNSSRSSEGDSTSNNNNSNNNTDSAFMSGLTTDSQTGAASLSSKLEELGATGMMANLIDSSMFDELKDKMIESSSLLDSLGDDDDDECEAASAGKLSSGSHSHNGSLNHDCCRCQCHKSSLDSDEAKSTTEKSAERTAPKGSEPSEQDGPVVSPAVEPKATSDTNSTTTSPTSSSATRINDAGPNETKQADEEESKSSLACDMAVQCDLLN